ncbi:MAG: hypothetical protein AAFX50_12355, partial [Acidobacteriota bacterium]
MSSTLEKAPPEGQHCIAFAVDRLLSSGTVLEVALAVRGHLEQSPLDAVFVFDDQNAADTGEIPMLCLVVFGIRSFETCLNFGLIEFV